MQFSGTQDLLLLKTNVLKYLLQGVLSVAVVVQIFQTYADFPGGVRLNNSVNC